MLKKIKLIWEESGAFATLNIEKDIVLLFEQYGLPSQFKVVDDHFELEVTEEKKESLLRQKEKATKNLEAIEKGLRWCDNILGECVYTHPRGEQ